MKIKILFIVVTLGVFALFGEAQTLRKEVAIREMENETPLVTVNGEAPSVYSFQKITQKLATLRESLPRLTHDFLARLTYKPASKHQEIKDAGAALAGLSLDEMLKDKALMKSAWIQFDEQKQILTAKWTKPKLLNYGMLLKPALEKNFAAGDWLSFESDGIPSVIAKKDNELMLTQNGATKALGWKELNRLLASSINKDGISLSVDGSGNLILQATGPKASQFAKLKS